MNAVQITFTTNLNCPDKHAVPHILHKHSQTNSRALSDSCERVFKGFLASSWAQDVLIIELTTSTTSPLRRECDEGELQPPHLPSFHLPAGNETLLGLQISETPRGLFLSLSLFFSFCIYATYHTIWGEHISKAHVKLLLLLCLKSVQAVLAPHRYNTAFKATIKPPTSERNRFSQPHRNRFSRTEEAAKMTTY